MLQWIKRYHDAEYSFGSIEDKVFFYLYKYPTESQLWHLVYQQPHGLMRYKNVDENKCKLFAELIVNPGAIHD
jgi:hypothetical protein